MDLLLAMLASGTLVLAPVPDVPSPAELMGTYGTLAPLSDPLAIGLSETTVPAATEQPVFRYSEAYYRRLDIHRKASYAILPLFAFQFAAGQQLYEHGSEAPAWARRGHPVGAAAISTLFLVNGYTGVKNLWEGRQDPDRPTSTVVHGLTMLTSAAGFTATAILGMSAEGNPDRRQTHRTVAISSMAIATAGYLTMLLRD